MEGHKVVSIRGEEINEVTLFLGGKLFAEQKNNNNQSSEHSKNQTCDSKA